MNQTIQEQFHGWLRKTHPHKLDEYPKHQHKKIVDVCLEWIISDIVPDTFEELMETNSFRLLDEYFSKYEFLPLSDLSIEEENLMITGKLRYTPIVLSLSVEKRFFRYFVYHTDGTFRKIIKYKFEILGDGRVCEITRNLYFETYEAMKKHVILNETIDYNRVVDPRKGKLTNIQEHIQKSISKRILSDTQVIYHFIPQYDSKGGNVVHNQFKINFKNGSLYFISYPLSMWSNMISEMLTENSLIGSLHMTSFELDLITTKEIFIIYALFRLTNFLEYTISVNIFDILCEKIIDFPKIQGKNIQDAVISNIVDLYLFCDYVEDKQALLNLIEFFKNSNIDRYEKQKFYDMIFKYKT
jgi:hypothetical protein